eukprot:5028376-Karenia_brevis.AAC.1
MHPLTPADLEAGNRFHIPFTDFYVEAATFLTVGYILRIPSHGGNWIALLPRSCSREALLCDSLYSAPFYLNAEELAVASLCIGWSSLLH